MTTDLVRPGLSLEEAAQLVAEQAERNLKPGMKLSVWTEIGVDVVLVGIAIPGQATSTLKFRREEYDGVKLYEKVMRRLNGD